MRAKLLLLGLSLWAGPALADPCEAPLPKAGEAFAGPVRYVGDGDSLCVGTGEDPRTWIEVRLADFYAVELHEPGGDDAKALLELNTAGELARCVAQGRSFDRVVARCTINGVSIGDRLRAQGAKEGGRGR